MSEELNLIVLKEAEAIETLLGALQNQHIAIIEKDIFSMEEMVSTIGKCNRDVAAFEFERRKITKGKPMSEVLNDFNNNELGDNVRKIQKLLHKTITQKENNELLIKQKLIFTNKMLSILNPDRTIKTYNSYGKVKK